MAARKKNIAWTVTGTHKNKSAIIYSPKHNFQSIKLLINDFSSSRVNTPYSEDFMHRRTQSLDSVSSGHSSGSGSTLNDRERESTRRRILVRPYEDPEEEQTIIIKRYVIK